MIGHRSAQKKQIETVQNQSTQCKSVSPSKPETRNPKPETRNLPIMPITIFLVDDHAIFLDGLRGILESVPELEILGQANDGWEAWDWLQENEVDLLMTDIQMPHLDGMELTQKVKARNPDQKVLVLSMFDDYSVVEGIFEAEAEGYVLKNSGRDELLQAIHRIQAGSSHYSKEVMQILMEEHPAEASLPQAEDVLSPREIEVLSLVCEELSTKEIAEKLFLSPRTVDTHRKHILQKTGMQTLVGLVKWAFRYGLVNA
jgi:DNA-binding NarL/FixJ family response regulator